MARELDEFLGASDDRPSLGRAGDRDPEAAPELQQPLVAKHTKRPQHRVRVDAENGGEVLGWGKTLTGLRLAVGDRAADLASDLFVEIGRIGSVHLDINHGAVHSSSTMVVVHT